MLLTLSERYNYLTIFQSFFLNAHNFDKYQLQYIFVLKTKIYYKYFGILFFFLEAICTVSQSHENLNPVNRDSTLCKCIQEGIKPGAKNEPIFTLYLSLEKKDWKLQSRARANNVKAAKAAKTAKTTKAAKNEKSENAAKAAKAANAAKTAKASKAAKAAKATSAINKN